MERLNEAMIIKWDISKRYDGILCIIFAAFFSFWIGVWIGKYEEA